jgi:hypothetical protein
LEEEFEKKEAPEKFRTLIEQIKNLSVSDLSEFVIVSGEKLGIPKPVVDERAGPAPNLSSLIEILRAFIQATERLAEKVRERLGEKAAKAVLGNPAGSISGWIKGGF